MCALSCGIVGLPNIGKSTLFNVLTRTQLAEAANYPFCTIEPNKAIVSIKDERLDQAAKIARSGKIILPQIEIVDIAGLVKGASTGNGLGNKFLSNIREVDTIIHVLRCFEDKDILDEGDSHDILENKRIVENELILSDLERLESHIKGLEKKAKNDSSIKRDLDLAKKLLKHLEEEKLLTSFKFDNEDDVPKAKAFHLLTLKPMLYLCNISDEDFLNSSYQNNARFLAIKGAVGDENLIAIPVKLESEFIEMPSSDREDYLRELEVPWGKIDELIKKCYNLLKLESFFTVGEKEARSWSMSKGSKAPEAAGKIHSDIEKNFIRASVMSFEDFISHGGEAGCKALGKLRIEGKDYIVKDGDVVHFLHSS